jgi:hypothetical protein
MCLYIRNGQDTSSGFAQRQNLWLFILVYPRASPPDAGHTFRRRNYSFLQHLLPCNL